MSETTVEYTVTWEYLYGDMWVPKVEQFSSRPQAEEAYDCIVKLEKAYTTPRNARMHRRTITVSSWEPVDRHA